MAKRTPLSDRRTHDVRGTDVLFQSVDTATEHASEQDEQPTVARAEQAPAPAAALMPRDDPDGDPTLPTSNAGPDASPNPPQELPTQEPPAQDPPKPVLAKVTLYIRPEQVVAIESIQLEQRQKTGRKPDKSDLVQEALDLLVEKYRSM